MDGSLKARKSLSIHTQGSKGKGEGQPLPTAHVVPGFRKRPVSLLQLSVGLVLCGGTEEGEKGCTFIQTRKKKSSSFFKNKVQH